MNIIKINKSRTYTISYMHHTSFGLLGIGNLHRQAEKSKEGVQVIMR